MIVQADMKVIDVPMLQVSVSPPTSHSTDTTNGLAECSQNIISNGKTTVQTGDKAAKMQKVGLPEKSVPVFHRNFKSPRRTLLNKRAMMANTGLALTRGDNTKRTMDGAFAHRRTLAKPLGFRGVLAPVSCHCYGTPSICTMCVSR
jgi:hypothetical protein